MKLHIERENFDNLITVTAEYIGVPYSAVKRDYYIVKLLQNLQDSEYADMCVFKGGTSLSKCYPGSINRFSEDIDLTFIPNEEMSPGQYDKMLKKVEATIIGNAFYEKITGERNNRSKSSFVWFEEEDKVDGKVKLEIGSRIKPEPYDKRKLKCYIQEYLEERDMLSVIKEYELNQIELNTLCIERTFIDKIMSVKRHAICRSLGMKVRHIYDVVKLFEMDVIQDFLQKKDEVKEIVSKVKHTDSYYLEKRDIPVEYDPTKAYAFSEWKQYFDNEIKGRYESLHQDLLYSNEKQDFRKAITTFEKISDLLRELGE
jgi:predicted nucleotidyltransferase component of viral defense system